MRRSKSLHIRLTFAKTEAMRYTGHLDLQRAWERTFRRAGLPLAYTQGFNPHPRLNLISALPLGFTSQAEIAEAILERPMSLPAIRLALEAALPPGITLLNIEEISGKGVALQTRLVAAEYVAALAEPVLDLKERIQSLLSRHTLPRLRKGKAYDLRPLILELEELGNEKSRPQRLWMRLMAKEGATGRPEEVLAALGLTPETTNIQRIRLIFRE